MHFNAETAFGEFYKPRYNLHLLDKICMNHAEIVRRPVTQQALILRRRSIAIVSYPEQQGLRKHCDIFPLKYLMKDPSPRKTSYTLSLKKVFADIKALKRINVMLDHPCLQTVLYGSTTNNFTLRQRKITKCQAIGHLQFSKQSILTEKQEGTYTRFLKQGTVITKRFLKI